MNLFRRILALVCALALALCALPALGEGSVCDYCAVRGLCRKDMWADAEQALPAQQTP